MAKNVKLTKSLVEALVPAGKPALVWDASLPGFGVKVMPSGSRVMLYQYRFAGRTRLLTIGKISDALTVEQARGLAKDAAADVRNGIDPQEEKIAKRNSLNVADLMERYLSSARAAQKTDETIATDKGIAANHIVPLIGKVVAEALTPDQVAKMRDQILAGKTAKISACETLRGKSIVRGGPGVARHSVVLLKTAFNWAIDEGFLKANPCKSVDLPPVQNREAILTVEEYGRMFDALDVIDETKLACQGATDAIRLIAFTACRRGEIIGLRWRFVELDKNRLMIPPSNHKTGKKTGKPRIVNLPAEAVEILERQTKRKPDDYVFFAKKDSTNPVSLRLAFAHVKRLANLSDDLVIHSLRHSVGSHLAMGGANIAEIQLALGHSQISTSQRYIHFAEAAKNALAAKAAAPISAAFSNRKAVAK